MKLPPEKLHLIGDLIYIPFVTTIIIVVSFIAISILLGKRVQTGLVSSDEGNVNLIEFVSTSPYNTIIPTQTSWANKILYVSGDKANLVNGMGIELFDPASVLPGTMLTIFNSPNSMWPTQLVVQWTGTPGIGISALSSIKVSLGTGMGVTVLVQQRIGPKRFVQIGGTAIEPPDLTPSALQPRDWVIFKYWSPDAIMCSSLNSCAFASTLETRDTGNTSNPCWNTDLNSSIGLLGAGGRTDCTNMICACPNPQNIYPPPFSPWCNS